jgi:hypothetical protein
MSEHSFLRTQWKLLLNIVTLLALFILVVAIHNQLVATFRNLAKVDAWMLLLILPIEALNYHAQAELYKGLFKVVGNKLKYGFLYRVSLELNFINHILPSGGVSGISYFGVRLRNGEITGGKATVIQVMKVLLLILSFEVLLVIGLLSLAFNDKANNFVVLVTSSITTLMIIGTFAFVLVVGSERRINATFTFITRILNRILHIFLPKSPETISMERAKKAFKELHANYKTIETNWRDLKAPFLWALLANVTEVLSVYVVYLAFGRWINIGAVILAYAVANFAGLVSVMPGGIGVYEALMTAVLVASGVPAAISLPATVMYRVVNTILQVPLGYYLYHKALIGRHPGTETVKA